MGVEGTLVFQITLVSKGDDANQHNDVGVGQMAFSSRRVPIAFCSIIEGLKVPW